MSDDLKIAVLGCGRIGRMHAELLQFQTDGVTVSSVFDVFAEAAEATAARIGCAVAATAEEAIAGADAIAICTSTPTHVDLIVAGAEAGKAIFCEKPISLDLAEVDRGLAAVAAAGVPLHIGFNRRFDPGHAAVQAAVSDGSVGSLRQVAITSRDPAPPPIEYVKVSGGIFRDMTIHDFDMARFVTGVEVESVYAVGSVTVDPAIGDAGDLDTVTVLLTHTDGTATTIVNCRAAAYGYDQRVEAFGADGMASSNNQLDQYTTVWNSAGHAGARVPEFFLDRYIPSYLIQWRAFVDAVRAGDPPPVSGADGRAPLVIGLAAMRSVELGRPVLTSEIV